MINQTENKTQEKTKNFSNDKQKGIEHHKTAATHLEAAAKHHRDAAKYQEEGNIEKAHQSSVYAHGHCCIANENQRENAKFHALNNMK